jgi:hypothetical protein
MKNQLFQCETQFLWLELAIRNLQATAIGTAAAIITPDKSGRNWLRPAVTRA